MAKGSDYSKHSVARLRTELEQEREVKELLEKSVSDLRRTMCELQERLQSVDGEGNEWKTRFETQVELNDQLERQILLIQEKLEDIRGNPIDPLAFIRSYDDMAVETLQQRVKLLTEERSDLQRQLMDCHLQIEQEGKAFHKTNDERRAYLTELAKLSSTHQTQRRHCSDHLRRTQGSKWIRVKQSSKPLVCSNREKEGDKNGLREHVNGGGGGGGGGGNSVTEREVKRKSQKESRLSTMKNSLKHYS